MLLRINAVLILYHLIVYIQAETVGDSCTLADKRQGECVVYNDCKTPTKKTEAICGFRGKTPIVCCPKIDNPISKTQAKCQEWIDKPLPPGTFITIVTGGKNSLAKEFPNMAALGYGDKNDIKWFCGGTLISEKFVLTAAHCISSKSHGDVKYVRLGDLDLKLETDDAKPQNFLVVNRIKHPKYTPLLQYNDIALVELDKSIVFNLYVWPACLHTTKEIDVKTLTATGWGKLGYFEKQAEHLQKVDLAEMPNEQCKGFYSTQHRRLPDGIVDESQLCAFAASKDTCQGDSGGPLHISIPANRGIRTVVGVTSFGKACGIADAPGVYTRVSYYVPWIESIVWPN